MRNTSTKPVLRFPEFKEDWKECKLSDFLTRYSETNKDEEFSLDEILSLSSHYGIVSRKELLEDTYSNVNHLSYKKTRLNDLVYGKSISASYPYGLFKVNDYKDGSLSTLYYTFKVKENVFPKFIDCYFSLLNRANNFLKKHVLVGDRYITADADYLLSGQICLPTQKEEQKKIADSLIQIDNRIAQLKEKKENLELYKKGIMQKLFSQELRFKDENGKEFPKWEKKKLGKVAEINPSSQKLPDSFIYIDLESVVQGRLTKEERITKAEAPSRAQRLLRKNDILFQMVRPYQKNNYFFNRDENDFVASTGYAQIRTNNNCEFLFHFLHEETFVRKVIEKCTGTGYPAINSTDLSNIVINIPKEKEQSKIANFLSAIDDRINQAEIQIQQFLIWKKGLPQKMFC